MEPHLTTQDPERSIESLRLMLRSVTEEVGQCVVGQSSVIRQLLLCFVAGGHALLEGPSGVGKSLLVNSVGVAFGLAFTHVPMTTDLTPNDLLEALSTVGSTPATPEEQTGHLFAHLMLADQIDQSTPRVQTYLLQCMQDQTVTMAGNPLRLPSPFVVAATQSPAPLQGPHPLSAKQLDSFLMKLVVQYPSALELTRIVGRTTGSGSALPRRVGDPDALSQMIHLVRQVPIARHVTDYAVRLVLASHPEHPSALPLVHQYVAAGPSPRGAQTLVLAAKAAALIDGRYNVSFGDLRLVALPALRHRVVLTETAREVGIDEDAIIRHVLDSIEEEP